MHAFTYALVYFFHRALYNMQGVPLPCKARNWFKCMYRLKVTPQKNNSSSNGLIYIIVEKVLLAIFIWGTMRTDRNASQFVLMLWQYMEAD